MEIADQKDFFQLSEIFPLYVKVNNYSYGDNDMKMLIALIRSLLLYNYSKMQLFRESMIVKSNSIDNCDEIF